MRVGRRCLAVLGAIAIAGGLWLAGHSVALADAPIVVTDDRGISVTFDREPRRVVSLLPSLAESVCTLGACDRLVGTDRYTNWPESVRGLPKVGGGLDPNIEAVVALRPDLVLLATSSRATQRFESLGLKVLVLEPRTHADVKRVLLMLGQVLGTATAPGVWKQIDHGLGDAASQVPAAARGRSVYFEINSAPYAAGASSFIGETLQRLGMRNIVPPELGPFPKLNPEFVVRADPDLILAGERSAQGMEKRPGWSSMRAVRDGRICRFSPEQSDVLVRAGPRMAEAAQLMLRCLKDKA
ncbi:Iron complex transport system substrate-binding protein [Burkholderiales bacterium 8X]|nr:Iron complex transport system substrate-binding protein [Burkholderiales bacterium 8X]